MEFACLLLLLGFGLGLMSGALLTARCAMGKKGRNQRQKEKGQAKPHPVERIYAEVLREAGLDADTIRDDFRKVIQVAILDALPDEEAARVAGAEMILSLRVSLRAGS